MINFKQISILKISISKYGSPNYLIIKLPKSPISQGLFINLPHIIPGKIINEND